MTLSDFSTRAAREYLHSIVFVDDEIYDSVTGHPSEPAAIPSRFGSPFPESSADTSPPAETIEVAADDKPIYHPRQLMESFAREGMVCALYQPLINFDTGPDSELFRLCARADVVIFDWDLYRRDGQNLLPLIGNLVSDSQSTYPHHVRLFAIYTTKPNLSAVASSINDYLTTANLAIQVREAHTLVAGATRIIILGKPGVVARPPADKGAEVSETGLATRIIEEFSKMHDGILPSYAMHGLASVRRNSKRILDKFHLEMDGPFLVQRALLIEHEDAFDQLPELIAEEALAVLLDNQVPTNDLANIVKEYVSTLSLDNLDWPPGEGKSATQRIDLAREYLKGGAKAIRGTFKIEKGKEKELYEKLHHVMGCATTQAHKRLAALFAVRTRYFNSQVPSLGFGAIVKSSGPDGSPGEFSICLMPICDSIRLKKGAKIQFPFWRLKPTGDGANGRGVVVPVGGRFVELVARGKPKDMLWLARFEVYASEKVLASEANGEFRFIAADDNHTVEWVAQLKPAHAQRIAHDIAQSFSRVGVVEAEWLRLKVDKQ